MRYESKIDYTAIWTAVAVFSSILLAAFFWIRMLSRQREALLTARTAAEAANRAKDEFLASMSHELRTPLHAILGYADLLRVGSMGQAARKDALDTIAGSGRHLLALINDLLDLSRMRAGHLELNPAPVRLRALLEEIVAMVRVDARSKGLEFFLEHVGRSARGRAGGRQAPAADPAQPAGQRHQVHRYRPGRPGCARSTPATDGRCVALLG